MDSSISSDPFQADNDPALTDFRSERWLRAGATADEVDALSASFAAESPDAQAAEVRTINTVSDIDLEEALERMRLTGDFAGFRASAADPGADGPLTGFITDLPLSLKPEDLSPPDREVLAEGHTAAEALRFMNDASTQADADAALEAEAVAGQWYPSNAYLTVGEDKYRISNLINGYIAVRIGDEVTGRHVVAKGEPALQAALEAELATEAE